MLMANGEQSELALLIALIGEAVNNHYAKKDAQSRERARRQKARLKRVVAANRRLRQCLTRDKRIEYRAWLGRCKALGVNVSAQERYEVLSELVNRRMAA